MKLGQGPDTRVRFQVVTVNGAASSGWVELQRRTKLRVPGIVESRATRVVHVALQSHHWGVTTWAVERLRSGQTVCLQVRFVQLCSTVSLCAPRAAAARRYERRKLPLPSHAHGFSGPPYFMADRSLLQLSYRNKCWKHKSSR